MNKIVVLDAAVTSPESESWQSIQALGELQLHPRTKPEEVLAHVGDATIVLTNKVKLDASTLSKLPNVKYIGVLATGYNIIDLQAAAEHGITVCNVPNYSTESVAQLAFALLLEITHQVGHHSRTVAEGRWANGVDFSYWDCPLKELAGKTMGIVGYGNVGQAVARIAQAFGMNVLVNTRTARDGVVGAEFVDRETLFAQSDVVSLHCALTAETHHLINAERLTQMKSSAILLNLGRGDLIDEVALANALNSGELYAAGVDVLSTEPPSADNPLIGLKNCFITPHIGWASLEARERLLVITEENIKAFLAGKPQNVVG